jgi:molybdopterin-binding protein
MEAVFRRNDTQCGQPIEQFPKEVIMISARNQFEGVVKSVKLGNVMAEVIVQVAHVEIVSLISRASAESLGLKVGDKVKTIIKSTEVMIDK